MWLSRLFIAAVMLLITPYFQLHQED